MSEIKTECLRNCLNMLRRSTRQRLLLCLTFEVLSWCAITVLCLWLPWYATSGAVVQYLHKSMRSEAFATQKANVSTISFPFACRSPATSDTVTFQPHSLNRSQRPW
jgi:hypothetical protein